MIDVSSENESLARRVAARRWYHTIDLPGGVTTPGEYDLRGIAPRLPWPELAGRRCLDVGGRDGFYAFELERRGAATVVSLDLDDPADVHFPGDRPPDELIQAELDDGNAAFELARDALGSIVERRFASVYELDRDGFGEFDFAVLGTLLLHLRDPVSALRRIRSVLRGPLLLNEAIIPAIRPALRRRAIAEPLMRGGPFWWLLNPAGLRHLAESAGFTVAANGRPYLIPFGTPRPRPPAAELLARPLVEAPRRLLGSRGMLHAWLLLEPTRG